MFDRIEARALFAMAVIALAGACGDDDGSMPGHAECDAGPPPMNDDAGPPRDDAGPPPVDDAGPPAMDAGPAPDGGPPPVVFDEAEMAIIATLSPLPALPPNPTNAVADDAAAATLGQRLFFDARYSGPLTEASDLGMPGERGRVSCASCHSSSMMADDRSVPSNVSLGAGFHTRNAPAIANSAYYRWTNWGGRFSAQWELPPVVAEAPAIMNSTRLDVAHHVFDHYRTEYEAVFGAMEPALGTDLVRFPASGKPGQPAWDGMAAADQAIVNRIWINFGKAIEAYMRLIVSDDAPFDRFVAGDATAISESAKRGLRLFLGEARCISCHNGPTFSDDQFHNLGVAQTGPHVPMTDDGRFSSIGPLLSSAFNTAGAYSDDTTTGRLAGLVAPPPESTRAAFRTPTLRGVDETGPYMHSGQLATLEEVIGFYAAGGGTPASGTRSRLILPLALNDGDRADLLEFLRTLTGEPIPEALRTAP